MYKIRTYNAIALKGLERFGRQSYEVGSDIGHPDAFLLRSQKLHDVAVPDSLLAVARAGAGVNNVPIADYSRRGIVADRSSASCLGPCHTFRPRTLDKRCH